MQSVFPVPVASLNYGSFITDRLGRVLEVLVALPPAPGARQGRGGASAVLLLAAAVAGLLLDLVRDRRGGSCGLDLLLVGLVVGGGRHHTRIWNSTLLCVALLCLSVCPNKSLVRFFGLLLFLLLRQLLSLVGGWLLCSALFSSLLLLLPSAGLLASQQKKQTDAGRTDQKSHQQPDVTTSIKQESDKDFFKKTLVLNAPDRLYIY